MIQSVQEQELVLVSNTAPITFSDTDLRTGSANCFNGWLNHNEGTAQFNLVSGGIYEIDFNANYIVHNTELDRFDETKFNIVKFKYYSALYPITQ